MRSISSEIEFELINFVHLYSTFTLICSTICWLYSPWEIPLHLLVHFEMSWTTSAIGEKIKSVKTLCSPKSWLIYHYFGRYSPLLQPFVVSTVIKSWTSAENGRMVSLLKSIHCIAHTAHSSQHTALAHINSNYTYNRAAVQKAELFFALVEHSLLNEGKTFIWGEIVLGHLLSVLTFFKAAVLQRCELHW